MNRNRWAWLVLGVGAVILVLLEVFLPDHAVTPAPAPTVTRTVTVTPTTSAPSISVADVARHYAGIYAATGGSDAAWLDALRPLTAPDLLVGMTYTDRSVLPREPRTTTVTDQEAGSVEEPAYGEAVVTFSTGRPVRFIFQEVGGMWVCIDIEPAS